MAKLRLFGPVREAAGRAEDEFPGRSVAEVLAHARARYGERYAEVARTCAVWVNGATAEEVTALVDGDEVALLPPVSGG